MGKNLTDSNNIPFLLLHFLPLYWWADEGNRACYCFQRTFRCFLERRRCEHTCSLCPVTSSWRPLLYLYHSKKPVDKATREVRRKILPTVAELFLILRTSIINQKAKRLSYDSFQVKTGEAAMHKRCVKYSSILCDFTYLAGELV